MDEKRYIAALQTIRIQRADNALNGGVPQECAFHYGREVGINAGLRMAEQVLTEMLKDDKEQDQ